MCTCTLDPTVIAKACAVLVVLALLPDLAAAQAQDLSAELDGEQVGPYPADPDGSGTATIAIDVDKRRLCYELRISDIQPATAAHLHFGAPPVIGPIRLALDPPVDGASSGCTRADQDFLRALLANPGDFYVDVHNAEYPGAALRGQLER